MHMLPVMGSSLPFKRTSFVFKELPAWSIHPFFFKYMERILGAGQTELNKKDQSLPWRMELTVTQGRRRIDNE